MILKKYNQIIEQLKAQKKEQEELVEAEAANVEVEQKTKLQEFAEKVKNKVDNTLEKVDKAIQIAENKKKEILSQLEKIRKDANICYNFFNIIFWRIIYFLIR